MDRTRAITVGSVSAVLLAAALALATTTGLMGADRSPNNTPSPASPITATTSAEPVAPEAPATVVAPTVRGDDDEGRETEGDSRPSFVDEEHDDD